MSDFKELVFNDTPDVYLKMQRAETKSPYIFQPEDICEHNTYFTKRNKYVERVNKEKETFNNALRIIIKRRKDHLHSEEQRRIKRQENTKAFFFSLSQWLITLICILPIGFLDYVGIQYLISRFANDGGRWIGNFLEESGFPMFLQYVLTIPVWVGVAYIGLAAFIRKIGKKAYSEENYKKYAQSRWVIMLVLSIIEAAISFVCLA